MRKLYLILIVLITISCGDNCPTEKPVYKVNESTYFYSSESVEAPIVGEIRTGDNVSVLNTGNSKYWWRICYNGEKGFIMKSKLDYVSKNEKSVNFLNRISDASSKEFFIGYLLIFGILSFLLAYFVGRYRKIGFWFSFILGILLSPFVSWLLIILSRKKTNQEVLTTPKKILRKVIGVLLIIVALFGIIFNTNATKDSFQPYFIALGLMAYGIYLLK